MGNSSSRHDIPYNMEYTLESSLHDPGLLNGSSNDCDISQICEYSYEIKNIVINVPIDIVRQKGKAGIFEFSQKYLDNMYSYKKGSKPLRCQNSKESKQHRLERHQQRATLLKIN